MYKCNYISVVNINIKSISFVNVYRIGKIYLKKIQWISFYDIIFFCRYSYTLLYYMSMYVHILYLCTFQEPPGGVIDNFRVYYIIGTLSFFTHV